MTRLPSRVARTHLALAAALALGGTAPAPIGAAPLPYYAAVALPELAPQGPFGEGWTLGWALNDAGTVVGGTQGGSAVQWSASGGLRRLGGAGNAYAIAGDGTAVGWADLGSGLSHSAVRWSSGGGLLALADAYPGAALAGEGLAINDASWVLSGRGAGHVQLLRPGLAPLDLGAIASLGADIQANPVLNAGGMVASSLATQVAGQSVLQGWLWTETTGAHSFSAIAGQNTRLTGLNDDGMAVGWSTPIVGSAPNQGLLYDANIHNLVQLLPGFLPNDINNSGLMVGKLAAQDLAAAWANGAALNLNSVTANLGDYTLTQAIDVNSRGQILAIGQATPANPATFTGPALRTFLLSECLRCGQILPNPIASGTTLDVGADWFDAHNAVDFQNFGTLRVDAALANRPGATLSNQGELVLTTQSSWSNQGMLTNAQGGALRVSGSFSNFATGKVVNLGVVQMLDGAVMTLADGGISGGWENRPGSTFAQLGGSVFNGGRLEFDQATLQQQPQATFVNQGSGRLLSLGSVLGLAGSFTNQGRMDLVKDASPQVSLASVVEVRGRFTNTETGSLRIAYGSQFNVVETGLFSSAGELTLTQAGTRLSALDTAVSLNAGPSAVTTLGKGTELKLSGAAASLLLQGGAVLDVAHGGLLTLEQAAQGQLRGTVHNLGEVDVLSAGKLDISGRVDNGDVLLVQGADTMLRVLPGTPGAPATDAVLNNQATGLIKVTDGAMLKVQGPVDVTGPMIVSNGGRTLVEGGLFMVFGSVTGNGSFEQLSGETRVFGLLEQSSLTFSGGQVKGFGTIRGNVAFTGATADSDLRIQPGNSPGTLTVDGDLRIDGATYELELGDQRQDQLIVTGQLELGRLTVALKPHGGYLPDLDDRFRFIQAGQVTPGAGGSQVTVDTSALGDGWVQQLSLGPDGLQTTLDNSGAVQIEQVPAGQTVRVDAGSIAFGRELRVAGRLTVAGSMTNRLLAADPLTGDSPPGAPMVVEAGASLDVQAGGRFSNRTTLTNEGLISNAGRFEHRAGAELNNAGTLENQGLWRNDGILTNTGTLRNAAGARIEGSGLVMNFGRIDNEGEMLVQGPLENSGAVVNHAGGRFVVAAGARLTSPSGSGSFVQQAGGITVVDGLMALGTPGLGFNARFEGGTLGGTGTLEAETLLGGGVTLLPGNEGIGTLALAGTVTLTGAVLQLDVGTAGADLLDLTAAQLLPMAGPLDIRLRFGAGDAPTAGRGITLLTMTDPGPLNLAFVSVVAEVAQGPDGGYLPWEPAPGERVLLAFDGQALRYEVQAVPEPQPWMLLAGGLLAVGAFKRRVGRR